MSQHRVSSPASDAKIVPHQLESVWRELGELKRRLAGLERTDPLAASERRCAELAAVAVHLGRLLVAMQAARAVGECCLSASDGAKLLTGLEGLLIGLHGVAESLAPKNGRPIYE
jgi:hypothetical protein